MATRAHATTAWFANEWEKLYRSALVSGIVGDLAHKQRGGYHISIEDNPVGNYSIVRADDKAPPGTWPRNLAAAVDMNLAGTDMYTCHRRLRAVFNDHADPRRRYINAWNGWDGTNGPGRYDMVTNTVSSASDDHKWHIHLEIRRRWVTTRPAAEAILSILGGQSKADWTTSQQPKEEDMPLTNADAQLVATAVWKQTMEEKTDLTGRRYGQWAADDMNFRNYLFAPPGTSGLVNPPPPNSLLDLLSKLPTDIAMIKSQLAALAANPPGTVAVTDEQLERVLRRVLGSLDGASPA